MVELILEPPLIRRSSFEALISKMRELGLYSLAVANCLLRLGLQCANEDVKAIAFLEAVQAHHGLQWLFKQLL